MNATRLRRVTTETTAETGDARTLSTRSEVCDEAIERLRPRPSGGRAGADNDVLFVGVKY